MADEELQKFLEKSVNVYNIADYFKNEQNQFWASFWDYFPEPATELVFFEGTDGQGCCIDYEAFGYKMNFDQPLKFRINDKGNEITVRDILKEASYKNCKLKEFFDERILTKRRLQNNLLALVNYLKEINYTDVKVDINFNESLNENIRHATVWAEDGEFFANCGGGKDFEQNFEAAKKYAVKFAKQYHKAMKVLKGGSANMVIWRCDENGNEISLTEEVNLEEAVEIHDQLNPKIWTDDKELRPEVRAKILQIVDKFKSQLLVDGVDLKIEDIYILGSNANYNYTEESDLDVHIIADESFDCSAEHLPLLYNCYKALFNSKYDIRIKGINVELYVENKDKLSNVSAGIYSLNQGWIRNPAEYEIPEFDQLAVDRGVQEWEDRYYAITENPSLKKIDDYINELYELRKSTIQNGEFAEGNLIFKEIRRLGYLDDLKELKVDLTSQELSLEGLNAQKQINEEEQSFGDFIADMLTKNRFIMLSNYCKNYFYKIIGNGLGAYGKENFKYYKRRLLKKLAAINMLSEEDKTLSWEDLDLKYLYAPNLIKEIKKNNLKPYEVFLALLEAENMPTNLIPSLNYLQDYKKENYNRNNGYEINEVNTKLRYHYRGPVYHFQNLLSDDWEAYTEAVSDAQALNNLKAKAKNHFGYILQSRITLNPDYLELVTGEDDIPDEKFKPVKKCEKCGHQLNDAGECPVCDLGDHTALDEMLGNRFMIKVVDAKTGDEKEYNYFNQKAADDAAKDWNSKGYWSAVYQELARYDQNLKEGLLQESGKGAWLDSYFDIYKIIVKKFNAPEKEIITTADKANTAIETAKKLSKNTNYETVEIVGKVDNNEKLIVKFGSGAILVNNITDLVAEAQAEADPMSEVNYKLSQAMIGQAKRNQKTDKEFAEFGKQINRGFSREVMNEDLIVIEPNEGKEKIETLKHLIENEDTPDVKRALMTLMDIYLFQTYKPSDRKDSSLTDEEWQEIADWLKKQKESEINESLRTDPEAFEDVTLECKVRDWYAGNNPFEFQLKDISADLTWQDVIDALKSNDRGAFDKLLPLDTEPRENIWKKACQLYYAKTGKMFDGADEQRYIKELLKDEETYDDVVDDDYLTQKVESLSEEQKTNLKDLLEDLED